MEWYRQHLGLMNQLAEQGVTCGCCDKPLIDEGHGQVFSLYPELGSAQMREMVPSFKLFAFYMLQCQCGSWFHGDCLMPLQRETSVAIEIRQPNGVVSPKLGTAHAIHCPKCGQLIWEIRGQQPLRWQLDLMVRLPHPSDRQVEFLRSYELYPRPELSSWPSFSLRQRGKGHRAWQQYPFPRGGTIPSVEEISRNRWMPDNTQAIQHHIAREICTNEMTVKEILGNHIAERERTRNEREHLTVANALASNVATTTSVQEKKAGWLSFLGIGKK